LILTLTKKELANLIFGALLEQDEILKKELISKNDKNELQRVFHTTRSFALEYGYPEYEVERVIVKFIKVRGLNFFEQISVIQNGYNRFIGPYHIGPGISKYLLENEFKMYISPKEFANKYNFPVGDVVDFLRNSSFELCLSYGQYIHSEDKMLNPDRQEWLLKESEAWKSVKQLSEEYGTSIKKVIYVLATEKRRQIGTYEDAGTGENSYVVFQSMLKMLNNFFIHNDVPKYYKKSPLDSSVGFGNTPNSKMGKSLTKNWPRFLS